MKIIVSLKNGQTFQTELTEDKTGIVIGKKVGETFDGDLIGIPGYKLKITGGSDDSGFPMRPEIEGNNKERLLLSKGPGYKIKRKGERKRKMIRGNTIDETISQINTYAVEEGSTPLSELMPKEEKKKK